ncbi:MFS transporter [Dactylosporangium matsuzakiense]|uniref:MFS transporter n=1 Tax=Dactylosporangium matsuzakiense TaxID=53360 RepID=A0A9W6NLF4_9ACTN|nr:MFS transporter [Dactylosporangium matsuzakiense]GLL00822.1 MFS transporter [Dactylosporangium matsuzakiense]
MPRTAGPFLPLLLPLVCAGQFMVILDAAIVNVALPSIRADLGFTPAGLAWVVDAYLLTLAGCMLLGGRLADVIGHRRALAAGLLLFATASLVAGLAGHAGVLVGARAVQGLGAALLAPATLAVINTAFPAGAARARALGAWSAAGVVGGMAGAPAGGALTTGLSWRWVFLINVPIGVALLAAAFVALPRGTPVRRRLDLLGPLTGTAGLALTIYGVIRGGPAWTIAAGLVLLAGFAVADRRLFARRTTTVAGGLLLLFGALAIALWYFSALLLQTVHGYSALEAGLGQTPAAVLFVVVAGRAPALLPRTGPRVLVAAGALGFGAGFLWLALGDGGYGSAVLGPTLLVAAGIGLTFPTLMAAATAGVPPADAGTAGGLASTASQAGASIGLAVLATAGPFDRVFLIAAGLGVLLGLLSPLLPRRAAAQGERQA